MRFSEVTVHFNVYVWISAENQCSAPCIPSLIFRLESSRFHCGVWGLLLLTCPVQPYVKWEPVELSLVQEGQGMESFSITFFSGSLLPGSDSRAWWPKPLQIASWEYSLNLLSDSYRNVLITFTSCQDPCLTQNPDVHWIGTGALQPAQICSPAPHLRNSSALEDHLETPHGIGVCDFLAEQAGTHCLDPNFMSCLLCLLYCCPVVIYSLIYVISYVSYTVVLLSSILSQESLVI